MNHQLTPETPDAELVRRAQAGELDAFEALTSRYEQRVYALAMRMLRQEQDAEDVTQQTFLSVLEHLEGFRGEASFATWVLRIASHAALKVIRKRKGLDTISLEEATEGSGGCPFHPAPGIHRRLAAVAGTFGGTERNSPTARRGTGAAGDKHRLVFLLRDVEGSRQGNRRRAGFERGQRESAAAPRPAPASRRIDANLGRPGQRIAKP